jgi:hypothetical protein
MFFRYPPLVRTRLRSTLHHIRKIEFVLGRDGFDIAVVAHRAKTELIEEMDRPRMALLDITNIPADQLIESKHSGALEPV